MSTARKLYLSGYNAHHKKNDIVAAKRQYEQVVKWFPGTHSADLAMEQLEEIDSQASKLAIEQPESSDRLSDDGVVNNAIRNASQSNSAPLNPHGPVFAFAKPKRQYPASFGLIAAIAALGLIGTMLGVFILIKAESGGVIVLSYLIAGVLGSTLLFTFGHVAKVLWDIRDMLGGD